jgi:hypothetical protein
VLVGGRTDGGCGRAVRVIRRGGADGAAVGLAVPDLELLEAVVAGARRGGTGVEVGVLVERDDGAGVGVAEDVAASAAVVAPVEVVEAALADGVIADGRLGVRLKEGLVSEEFFVSTGQRGIPSSACAWEVR